jgi:hypothetical protein
LLSSRVMIFRDVFLCPNPQPTLVGLEPSITGRFKVSAEEHTVFAITANIGDQTITVGLSQVIGVRQSATGRPANTEPIPCELSPRSDKRAL